MDRRVTLITLGVADLDRALAFYRDGLGWPLSSASVKGDVAFIQLNGMALALWSRRLLAEDARLPVDEGWGGYSGYVADPDGHPWELAHNPFWELDEDGRLTLPT
jgi:uncharacterized protein